MRIRWGALVVASAAACASAGAAVGTDGGQGSATHSTSGSSTTGHGTSQASRASSGSSVASSSRSSSMSSAVSTRDASTPGDAGTPPPVADIYMNGNAPGVTGDVLFRFDVSVGAISIVGPLTGCSGVQDVALDDASNMVASNGTTMWFVDRTTGACTGVAATGALGSLPVALTFVPKATFGTASQALVGYTVSNHYVRVDVQSGSVTVIGALGDGYQLVGDFVAVDDGPTYVSVDGNGCQNCLVEIDPTSGAVTKVWGSTGYVENGLAYWGGAVYGFNIVGKAVETSFMGDAEATMLLSINPNGYTFAGAGSTTAAPLVFGGS